MLLRISAGVLCALFAVLCFVLPRGGDRAEIPNSSSYQGVLSLWCLDGFEGGTGSRADFLARAARKFEAKYPGVFIQVSAVTAYEAEDRRNRGLCPDIFVYSYGYDLLFSERYLAYTGAVTTLDAFHVSEDAVPIWAGGYFTFRKSDSEPLVAGYALGNDPFLAAVLAGTEGVTAAEGGQKSAYEAFVFSGRNLLGTQRDVVRVQKDSESCEIEALTAYTDLIQFASVLPVSADRAEYAMKFLEYLTSDDVQARLTEIGMLSTTGLRLYDGARGELEAAYPDIRVPSLGRTAEEIAAQRDISLRAQTDESLRREIRRQYGIREEGGSGT